MWSVSTKHICKAKKLSLQYLLFDTKARLVFFIVMLLHFKEIA